MTPRFFFLRSLLRENGRLLRLSKIFLKNSLIAKYRDLSVSRRSINYLPKPTTDKSRYFAQPRPIIVNCFIFLWTKVCKNFCDNNITVTEQENYGFDNCVTFMTGSYLQPRGQYAQVVFGIVEKADVKPMQYSRRLSLDSNGEDGIHNFKTV